MQQPGASLAVVIAPLGFLPPPFPRCFFPLRVFSVSPVSISIFSPTSFTPPASFLFSVSLYRPALLWCWLSPAFNYSIHHYLMQHLGDISPDCCCYGSCAHESGIKKRFALVLFCLMSWNWIIWTICIRVVMTVLYGIWNHIGVINADLFGALYVYGSTKSLYILFILLLVWYVANRGAA